MQAQHYCGRDYDKVNLTSDILYYDCWLIIYPVENSLEISEKIGKMDYVSYFCPSTQNDEPTIVRRDIHTLHLYWVKIYSDN